MSLSLPAQPKMWAHSATHMPMERPGTTSALSTGPVLAALVLLPPASCSSAVLPRKMPLLRDSPCAKALQRCSGAMVPCDGAGRYAAGSLFVDRECPCAAAIAAYAPRTW